MRTTPTPRTRRLQLCLVSALALTGCGGALRSSTIQGHRVLVDTTHGNARTTLRIDECAARTLHYDTDFDRWGLEGEMDGALFESPEEVAAQLIDVDYPARCRPSPTPETRPVLIDRPANEPAEPAVEPPAAAPATTTPS